MAGNNHKQSGLKNEQHKKKLIFFDFFYDYRFKSLSIYETYCVITKTPCIIVGNTGSGKSEAYNFLKQNFKDVMFLNTVTMASLKQISYEMNNYNGIIFIDDIGAINTDYMRITTMTTLVYLAYQHYLRRLDVNSNFEIRNFNGSLIINVQPSIWDEIVKDTSFEANIMDKTYRYYNIRIADNEPFQHPKIKGLDSIRANFDKIKVDIDKHKVETLANAFLNFNSPARRYKIVYNFVKLTAIFNNHKEAKSEDYNFVSKLLLNNVIENELLERQGITNKFKFNTFLFNIMLVAKYYGNVFHYSKLTKYLNVSQKTIYRYAKLNGIKVDNGFIVFSNERIMRVIKNEL